MKTISIEQKEQIEDAANAGLLLKLPPAVVEKDIHVTDALSVLASINLSHTAYSSGNLKPNNVPVRTSLVFAGGTCLSKAHGLTERMSEDIDIKVKLEDIPENYTLASGRSDRFRLGELQKLVTSGLISAGFSISAPEVSENPRKLNSRRYFHLSLDYKAVFSDNVGSLRPQLKVELIHRHTRLPSVELPFTYLLDKLTGAFKPPVSRIDCISIEETLAEKVLSILRRCAWNWDGRQAGAFDPALVRHVYDVWCILRNNPDATSRAEGIFPALVAVDQAEFGSQHVEFQRFPRQTLLRALTRSRVDDELRRNYSERLVPLVYAKQTPNFAAAYLLFEEAAARLLETLP